MGGGTSVLSPENKYAEENDFKLPLSTGSYTVPLSALVDRVRVYQSSTTGEVLVLVDCTAEKCSVISDPTKWFECNMSSLQNKYFSTNNIAINRRLLGSASSVQSLNSNVSASSDVVALPVIKTLSVESNSEAKTDELFSVSRATTASLPIISLSLGGIGNNKLETEATNNLLGKGSNPESARKTIDMNQATHQTERAMVASQMPQRARPRRGTNSENFVSSDSAAQKSSRSSGQVNRQSSNDLPALASSCQHCGVSFHKFSTVEIDEHMTSCAFNYQLKANFMEIDEGLRRILTSLNEENQLKLNEVLSNAIAEFEAKSALAHDVVIFIKDVMSIKSSSSDGQRLENLQNQAEMRLQYLSKLADDNSSNKIKYADQQMLVDLMNQACYLLRTKRSLLRQYNRVYHKPSDYNFIRRLSRGAFGTVYLGQYNHDPAKSFVAIKVMEKYAIREGEFEQQILRERSIMTTICKACTLFVKLFASFQTRDHLYMVMEYVPGGDCCSLLLSRKRLPEKMAKFIIVEVAYALASLHALGFMHRDIKPDNILFAADGHIRLADFGMAAPISSNVPSKQWEAGNSNNNAAGDRGFHWQLQSIHSTGAISNIDGPFSPVSLTGGIFAESSGSGVSLVLRGNNEEGFRKTVVGNISYAAPETCIGSYYNQSIDWWALGVMFYHLLTGKTPFEAPTVDEIRSNILDGRIDWSLIPDDVSKICMNFIGALLTRNGHERLGSQSSQHVFQHPYFNDIDIKALLNGPSLTGISLSSQDDFQYFDYFSPNDSLLVPDFASEIDGVDDEFLAFNFLA